jgi:hypothetical protein
MSGPPKGYYCCPTIATRSSVADAFAFRPFVRTARACGQPPADDSSELHEPMDSGALCPRRLSSEALVFSCCLLRRDAYADGRLTGIGRRLCDGFCLKHGILHDRLAECRPYLSEAITCGRPNAARARSTMSWITAVFRAV